MTTSRPVFLQLTQIKLPISALVSILHRVSGVLMIISMPIFAILFAQALQGPEGFAASAAFLNNPLVKLGLFFLGWALLHHLFTGIRYVIIDLGFGVDLPVARTTGWTAFGAALVMTIVVGGGLLL
ncbi:MAG TPA: succinate dehydrogenase, cytochrome b556 subunit [Chromatiaceae bacterium]|jgi:succinate dehydrogenase / fumarate reductase cytochrome b subunit|nr:MAG: hypothetical protein N838_04960 [Thiohalocapsa sp. PB-PSB1]QQO55103.1 MAG: succinate dehydrogenase, cytochrome b556 subunit [Thiohalocapsa sp. PB-PSB1]HBG96093.1 succinate dehydrogenase, cytochrome b556 subunit [Chromatiaceae bacterium]HCS92391.1 succinate dehydrogenase, cytochrome b556 subunit [Chromatiaceae bacterium]